MKRLLRAKYQILFFLFLRAGFLFSIDNSVIIVDQTEKYLTIEVRVDEPTIEKQAENGRLYSHVEYDDWPVDIDTGLPYKSVLLNLGSPGAEARVISSRTRLIDIDPLRKIEEHALAPDSLLSSPRNDSQDSPALVSLHYIGEYKGNFVWAVHIHPFQYDKRSGRLTVNSEIVFNVTLLPESSRRVPIPADESSFLKDIGVIPVAKSKKAPSPAGLKKSVQTQGENWKISVDRDGLYRVSGRDLNLAGVDLYSTDIRTLLLKVNGREVPIYVKGWQDGRFDPDDYFEFWGESNRQTFSEVSADMYQDPWTTESVYWLSWGDQKGAWMLEEQGLVIESQADRYIRPYSYYDTVHAERNNIYDRLNTLSLDEQRDHFFADWGIGAGKKFDYPFQLWYPDEQSTLPVYVRVMLAGRTTNDSIAHDVSAFLNDTYIFSDTWWKQDYLDKRLEDEGLLSGSDLKHGDNSLSIVNNVSADYYDYVFMNWFDVTYPRHYRAHDGFIKFSIPPGYNSGHFLFSVDGFDGEQIDIYKLGYSKIGGARIEEMTDFEDFTSVQIAFQDYVSSADVEYVAVEQDKKLKPLRIIKDQQSSLKNPFLAADYVIIAHSRFIESPELDELAELRRSSGYQVLKLDVQDIYDEFNHGRPSSFAIKDFLQWAYDNWRQPGLKYVLFVGDGSYRRYYYSLEADSLEFLDLIPVYMRPTYRFGTAASDHWYALLEGEDEIADIYVGRLPVRNDDELAAVIDKIVRYETDPPSGGWQNRILFIGGEGQIFRAQSNTLVEATPARWETRRLFTERDALSEDDPYYGGTPELLDQFADGCAVMSFHGHGGGAIWADNGLLTLEGVTGINTGGKYPFVLSMTCFTGSFEAPAKNSLADALLFSADEGSMAILGSSGTGWILNDYYFQSEILNFLYQHPDRTLGEIVNAGKIAYLSKYYGSYITLSQVNQYHILGDPALRLKIPAYITTVVVDNPTPRAGDVLRVTSSCPFQQGFGRFDLVDSDQKLIFSRDVSIEEASAQTEMPIPESFSEKIGYIRFYGSDELGGTGVHGSAAFSLTGVIFDSCYATLQESDSLTLSASITSRESLTEVYCICLKDTVKMKPVEDNRYVGKVRLGVTAQGYHVQYTIYAEMSDGTVHKSRTFSHFVSNGVDLAVNSTSFRLTGDDFTTLSVKINNLGDQPVEDVPIVFQTYTESTGEWQTIGYDTVGIAAYSTETASLAFSAEPGVVGVGVEIDPGKSLNDVNRDNNRTFSVIEVTEFDYIPQKGLFLDNRSVSPLLFDENLSVELAPGTFAERCVVRLAPMSEVIIFEQPGFRHIENTPAYRLSLSRNQDPAKDISVSLKLDEKTLKWADSTGTDLNLFRYEARLKKWLRVPSSLDGDRISAELDALGPIAVLQAGDGVPPTVEVSIDGQPYIADAYYGAEPHISVLIQDLNGIDLYHHFHVLLNGNRLTDEELALPDTSFNGNQIMLELKPELSPGRHTFELLAMDCNGNAMEPLELFLRVSGQFDIQMLGTYPNPFKRETSFAYVLTLPAEKISIKIYTTSGRKIRDLDPVYMTQDPNPFSADYHEVVWDGTDEDGYDVANGVYFYRMTATSGGKSEEITGKIARIR